MQSGTSHLEGALGELARFRQAHARLALQGLQHSAHNRRSTMRVQLHHILACIFTASTGLKQHHHACLVPQYGTSYLQELCVEDL